MAQVSHTNQRPGLLVCCNSNQNPNASWIWLKPRFDVDKLTPCCASILTSPTFLRRYDESQMPLRVSIQLNTFFSVYSSTHNLLGNLGYSFNPRLVSFTFFCGPFFPHLDSDDDRRWFQTFPNQKSMVWQGRTHSLRLALDHLCSNETLMPVRLLCPASSQQLEGLPKQAQMEGSCWVGKGGYTYWSVVSCIDLTIYWSWKHGCHYLSKGLQPEFQPKRVGIRNMEVVSEGVFAG